MANKPTKVYKNGVVSLCQWSKEVEGKILTNFTIEKSYFKDGSWKYTSSFSKEDLLRISVCIDKYFSENIKTYKNDNE